MEISEIHIYQHNLPVKNGPYSKANAKGFDGGRFSPVMDEPTHVFHDWYARKILKIFY